MSDETLVRPENADDACDQCAPTQRDPELAAAHGTPARGVALSVLWWLESDEDEPKVRQA